jgi:hypothetical protein
MTLFVTSLNFYVAFLRPIRKQMTKVQKCRALSQYQQSPHHYPLVDASLVLDDESIHV